MDDIKALADTLVSVTRTGMKAKEVVAAVREHHPKASKKHIVRAAFYALTETTPNAQEQAKHLHNFALSERGEEDGEPKVIILKKKKSKEDRKDSSEHPFS